MEERTLIKTIVRVGNSSGVILPRSWLNRQARIEIFGKTDSDILRDVLGILQEKNISLENILGLYLIGSYARGDYDEESDVDVLIITDGIDKIIKKDNHEIFLVSEGSVIDRLSKSLYIFSALNEARPLLNKGLLEKYKKNMPKIKTIEIFNEIKRILKINKIMIDSAMEKKENILDGTAYSLVLRFRELYLLRNILKEKKASKKEFLGLVGKKLYQAYLRIKRDQKEVNDVNGKEALGLYEISIKWLKEAKDWKKE